MTNSQIEAPWIVRMKPGALERLGLYLARPSLMRVALLHSEDACWSRSWRRRCRAFGITVSNSLCSTK
jgi:hypothetical protein